MRRWLAATPFLLVLAGVWLVPAAAQGQGQEQDEPETAAPVGVDISFDLDEFSPALEDWPVEFVEVTGNLEDGKDFTVEMRGSGDRVLWSATQPFTAPSTRIRVGEALGVGDVTAAGISQAATAVASLLVTPEIVDPVAGGGGSSGQVATSMVLVIIIAVILFRTPLPAASSQRWTQ